MTNTETDNKNIIEFNRDAVENLGESVRITDKDENTGLELFCYVKCTPEDSEILHQCRGVVFHDKNIIMHAFPYTMEITHDETDRIQQTFDTIFKDCMVYDAYEGALIRMFNFSGKWYISTHRKLDAFKSKWASRESFGSTFEQALKAEEENNKYFHDFLPKTKESILKRFQQKLNPDKQYMFLVRHNKENRIVSLSPQIPRLYHVGTFVNGKLDMTDNINIPYPRKHNFSDTKELVKYVENIDITELQGVIVFTPDNKQYKILNKEYQNLFDIRGNEPSIKYRYLQIRTNPEKVDLIRYLYPNMIKVFEDYETILFNIARRLYESYVDRHIKGIWSKLPVEDYKIDRACHLWHIEDKRNNRISIEKIIEVMNEQPATNLNKMIKRFNEEKKEKLPEKQHVRLLKKEEAK